jgi:hypothetical protein
MLLRTLLLRLGGGDRGLSPPRHPPEVRCSGTPPLAATPSVVQIPGNRQLLTRLEHAELGARKGVGVVVACRVRPLSGSEKGTSKSCLAYTDDLRGVTISTSDKSKHGFAFQRVFREEESQVQVFKEIGVPLVEVSAAPLARARLSVPRCVASVGHERRKRGSYCVRADLVGEDVHDAGPARRLDCALRLLWP